MHSNDTNNQSRNTAKKLHLKKETIKVLQSTELKQVVGGATILQGCIPKETDTCPGFCGTAVTCSEGCPSWSW